MIVAREKRKKNVAEYVLYMWQVEDTIRAFNFNINTLEERLLSQFKQPPHVMDEIRDWYTNLILAMHEEGITQSGHLQIVKSLIDEMYQLHHRLMETMIDPGYIHTYKLAKENINSFRTKLGKSESNEIELCFFALYGLLLLRLKKKEVTEETLKAMNTFSTLLSHLSASFKKMEEGKIEI
ncbi:MAG: DUF4924 family protein [Bacteroidota bacterium]|nr:MAG: DUF4924 family protein [Bacteroidota bacterium]